MYSNEYSLNVAQAAVKYGTLWEWCVPHDCFIVIDPCTVTSQQVFIAQSSVYLHRAVQESHSRPHWAAVLQENLVGCSHVPGVFPLGANK